MPRWEPDAYGRLQQAALELFGDRGFDGTTVTDIAERAGLTKRTYFSHFADKREVLFSGSEEFQQLVVEGMRGTPNSTPPLEVAVDAIAAAGKRLLHHRHAEAVARGKIIASSRELQERNLVKRAALSEAIAEVLRERGEDQLEATLVATSAVTVFYAAFGLWLHPSNEETLDGLLDLVRQRLVDSIS